MDAPTLIAALVLVAGIARLMEPAERAATIREIEDLVEAGRQFEHDRETAAVHKAAEAALIELRAVDARALN